MNMKLKTLAAVCALAFAGQAFALNPATTTAAGTIPLFISGSSALQQTIGQIATSLFVSGTIDAYFDSTGNGANYRTYSGTFKSAAPVPSSLWGKNGAVYEMAKGGSILGVVPVALADANAVSSTPTKILDMTTCTDTHTVEGKSLGELWTCTGALNKVPDAGVSDVEPALFVGINVPVTNPVTPAATPAVIAALNAAPSLAQPIAAIVTPNLVYDNANGHTGEAVSSLTKAQVTGLMSGYNPDWNYVDGDILTGQVVVCRRVAGSGTQAAINDFFFNFPCSSSSLPPATNSVGAGSSGNWTGSIVIENSGSGQVASCMSAVEKGTATGYTIDTASGTISTHATGTVLDADGVTVHHYITLPAGGRAIGLMGLDRTPSNLINAGINGYGGTGATELYNFLGINGVAASVENATTGAYDVVVNNSWNNRLGTVNGIAPLSGLQLDFYNAMKANSGSPSILGACKTPAVPGVAALADPINLNYNPATTSCTGYTNILLNPVMRTDKANSCMPAKQVQ